MGISKKPASRSPTQEETHERVVQQAVGYKRLNAPVPTDLYRRMQQQALDEGRSVSEITRELWAHYLDRGRE